MIDFHVHLGNLYRTEYPTRPCFTAAQLIDRMNREGVELSVLLPLESPEGGWGWFLTEEAVAARDQYPERLIAFAVVDPRYPHPDRLLEHFVTRCGCRGFGEHVCPGEFDCERNLVLYRKCAEHGLPVVFEINTEYCTDEVGLPRLERCLKDFPEIAWCGHGPGFWCAISGDDDRSCGYPTGKIQPGGAIELLLEKYDNLWLDLSAGSGYNALTRDPDYTVGLVDRWWHRMLMATDYMGVGQKLPQFQWLRELDITDEMRTAIGSGNARKLLGL